jgi:hypothetical protein
MEIYQRKIVHSTDTNEDAFDDKEDTVSAEIMLMDTNELTYSFAVSMHLRGCYNC